MTSNANSSLASSVDPEACRISGRSVRDGNLVGLVPAYKPTGDIVVIVLALLASGAFHSVYVVDDGSGPEYDNIFRDLRDGGAHVLRHFVNLGKGMALRTGMNVVACEQPLAAGVVTFDADGQHRVDDIIAVARQLGATTDALVLGYREVPREAPFRSRFGNAATHYALRFFSGMKLKDTQTGLRGIPLGFIPHLLRLKTIGYDFELDMLITARHQKLEVVEIPIQAVYINGNATSHFNPILDSMKIYFVFVRFSSVSLATAVIDYLVFSLTYLLQPSLLFAMLSGRSVAATFQFLVSYSFVFREKGGRGRAVVKYMCVLGVLTTLAYMGIYSCDAYLGITPFISKVMVEGLIFLVSFLLQRDLVFANRGRIGGE